MGLSNKLFCEAGSFSGHHNPHRFFQSDFEALFHHTGTLCCGSLSHSPVVPSSLSTCKCGTTQSASHCLARSPLCPCCPSLSLLPVWVNVSSLTSWLSDFHTVWFSGSSGYFLFLNLLLSFFLFCKETKFIYLCLHLVLKSLNKAFSLYSDLTTITPLSKRYKISLLAFFHFKSSE